MDKATMIITLDYASEYIGVLFDDPSDERDDHPGLHENIMTKEQFFKYYELDPGDVVSAFYEPRVGVFMVQYDDGEVEGFGEAKDHPVLQAIDDMAEQILNDELIIKNNLYPGVSYREDGGWLHTLEKLATQIGDTERFKSLDDIPDSVWKDPAYRIFLEDNGIVEDMKGQI